MSRASIVFIAGLSLVALIVVGGMLWARGQAIATYGSASAQQEWNEWRQAAQEQSDGRGPVIRKMPKSDEPPALVLMRDHFGACLGAALMAATGVYGTLFVLLRGAVGQSGAIPVETPGSGDQERGDS